MSVEIYSIPRSYSARYEFEQNAINLATEHALEWSIPETTLTNLGTLRTSYEAKYAVAANHNTQSPSATVARDAAWAPLETALIDLYNHHLLNNDAISAPDKETLFIHTRGGGHSAIPASTTTPMLTFVTKGISVLHVVYADTSTPEKNAKPHGVAFCELAYELDTVPDSPDACSKQENISRSGQAMVFQENQRGKKIYVYARWINRNGKVGPWSSLFSALIP